MPRTVLRLLAATIVASLAVLASPLAAMRAQATTLSGTLTADNAFNAYLSASASTLGTLIATGSDWGKSFSFTNLPLAAGQSYFLNIEAYNAGGGGVNPGAFIGTFTLSDTGFHFANGTLKLETGGTGWTGGFNASGSVPNAWSQPTGSVVALGPNGSSPWHTRPGIDAGAQWIWPGDAQSSPQTPTVWGGECANCVVDFQTRILASASASVPVPEPASFAVFAVALAGLAAAMRRPHPTRSVVRRG